MHPPSKRESYNVRDFGAIGDGDAKDTGAVQRAIDECTAAGGGTVLVPSGVYLCGTIYLKDHVNLHLDAGAVIKGSPDRKDYNADDAFPQNVVINGSSGAHLILALECNHVAITGSGTVDGNGLAFYGSLPEAPAGAIWPFDDPRRKKKDWLPSQMICFCECRQIRVSGVNLVHAPFWTLFFYGCETVQADSLYIYNDRHAGFDGIDINCCRDVTVSDCIIRTCDDCIALQAYGGKLKTPGGCENIAVHNCVLSSRANAIRVGVGDRPIRNAVFSNMVIERSGGGINIISRWSRLPGFGGTPIDNIRFDNFIIEAVVAFHITTGFEGQARVSNLAFSNIRALSEGTSYLGGAPGNKLTAVRFDHVDLEIRGGKHNRQDAPTPTAQCAKAQSFWNTAYGMTSAFYVENAARCEFHNVSVRWGAVDGLWERAFLFESADDVIFTDFAAAPPPGGAANPLLLFRRSRHVTVRTAREPIPTTAPLVKHE